MKGTRIIIYIISMVLLQFAEVTCMGRRKDSLEHVEQKDFRNIKDVISLVKKNTYFDRRKSGSVDPAKMKYLYEALSNTMNAGNFKKWLRQEALNGVEETTVTDVQDEFEGLVENELLNALSKKSSALLDRPYVQKKGRNDFLVIRPDMTDPFVTIVPNDIYYNSEKKCINWLDDCNQKGLRERLLQKVNSPFK